MSDKLYFNFFVDCEATQPAVHDAALGERASRGIADILEGRDMRGTFHVIPSDLEASPKLYRDLHVRGHEIGLHVHPAADGYAEFLGVYGPDVQREILSGCIDRFVKVMGFRPLTMCPGYASANDYTYGVLYELGFRHGITGIPTRVLPECAAVHAGAPLDPHYAHRFNRVLVGDLDFVEIPPTIDPDSRMWGGKHPQDLRIELVDAKNHWYTIKKSVDRQIAAKAPIKVIRAITHNIFEYGDERDFRRQTMVGVLDHVQRIATDSGLEFLGTTAENIAAAYRQAVPLGSTVTMLSLDRRGYQQKGSNA